MSDNRPASGPGGSHTPFNPKAQAKADKAYAKANRPWYKKKRFILPLILLVFIIIGIALGGGNDETPTSTGTESSAPAITETTAAEDSAPAEETTPPEEAAPAFPGAQESDVVGQAGDELTLGEIAVTAAPIVEGDATFGPTLCTTVNVVNNSDETIDFNAFDWKLQAPGGTILNSGFGGSDSLLSAGQIAPGGSTGGDVCFDAANPESGQYVVLYEPIFSFFSDRAAWINQR